MYAFPDTGLAMLDLVTALLPEAQRVYLWQQSDALDAASLPAVQIVMLPGAVDGPEKVDVAVLTAWTSGDLQQASALMRLLLSRMLERAHLTPHGRIDYVAASQSEAPETAGEQDLARYTATVEVDTRATGVVIP